MPLGHGLIFRVSRRFSPLWSLQAGGVNACRTSFSRRRVEAQSRFDAVTKGAGQLKLAAIERGEDVHQILGCDPGTVILDGLRRLDLTHIKAPADWIGGR
jgi:hypothetical protein